MNMSNHNNKEKRISRRKFIISSAKGAAGLGAFAGCNRRDLLGPDVRPPSAPKGLEGYIEYDDNNNKKAILAWNKHDLTDITGAFSETEIKGFNIYRDGTKINTTPTIQTSFTDSGNLEEGSTYSYQVSAIDKDNNESNLCDPYSLKVKPPGVIYKVTNPNASSSNVIDAAAVKTMVNAGILALTEEPTLAAAFNKLLPNITGSTKIGIKINTLAGFLNGGLCTHPEVIEAIVDGLKQTSIAVNNIIVFDDRMESIMNGGNFTLRNSPDDYRILSTFNEIDKFGNKNWSTSTISIAGVKQRFSKIVEEVDYIINVPVLKDHSSAGITFALKNFFGVIDNPGIMHTDQNNQSKTWCDPYIAVVYKYIASKIKLIIGDAIFGAERGGPSVTPRFTLNTLLFGQDPVAMDMYALDLINAEREKDGRYKITTSPDSNYPNRADARHIVTADSSEYDLGSLNKKVIEVKV